MRRGRVGPARAGRVDVFQRVGELLHGLVVLGGHGTQRPAHEPPSRELRGLERGREAERRAGDARAVKVRDHDGAAFHGRLAEPRLQRHFAVRRAARVRRVRHVRPGVVVRLVDAPARVPEAVRRLVHRDAAAAGRVAAGAAPRVRAPKLVGQQRDRDDAVLRDQRRDAAGDLQRPRVAVVAPEVQRAEGRHGSEHRAGRPVAVVVEDEHGPVLEVRVREARRHGHGARRDPAQGRGLRDVAHAAPGVLGDRRRPLVVAPPALLRAGHAEVHVQPAGVVDARRRPAGAARVHAVERVGEGLRPEVGREGPDAARDREGPAVAHVGREVVALQGLEERAVARDARQRQPARRDAHRCHQGLRVEAIVVGCPRQW